MFAEKTLMYILYTVITPILAVAKTLSEIIGLKMQINSSVMSNENVWERKRLRTKTLGNENARNFGNENA
jgi:hypothetical protein